MRAMLRVMLLGATALVVVPNGPAFANGLFDFLDPCIGARSEFRGERNNILARLDRAVVDADRAEPTPEYRTAWLNDKRERLGRVFDQRYASVLRSARAPNIDAARVEWVEEELKKIPAEQLNALIRTHFRQELKDVRIEQRSQGNAQVQEAQRELDRSCPMDAGNQALRGALTMALAPLNTLNRNLEIARRESGVGAQALALGTGISTDAINRNGGVFGGGLSGGENSFFRRNLGVRF